MNAAIGDRILIRGHHVGEPVQVAVILAVEGRDGAPPYRVRFETDGHEGLYFPGPDASIAHLPHASEDA